MPDNVDEASKAAAAFGFCDAMAAMDARSSRAGGLAGRVFSVGVYALGGINFEGGEIMSSLYTASILADLLAKLLCKQLFKYPANTKGLNS